MSGAVKKQKSHASVGDSSAQMSGAVKKQKSHTSVGAKKQKKNSSAQTKFDHLPELDYTKIFPSAPKIQVKFDFFHPINDGRCQFGETWSSAVNESPIKDIDPYNNIKAAKNYDWLTDATTWNQYQRGIKDLPREEIDAMIARWSQKISDGSWRNC